MERNMSGAARRAGEWAARLAAVTLALAARAAMAVEPAAVVEAVERARGSEPGLREFPPLGALEPGAAYVALREDGVLVAGGWHTGENARRALASGCAAALDGWSRGAESRRVTLEVFVVERVEPLELGELVVRPEAAVSRGVDGLRVGERYDVGGLSPTTTIARNESLAKGIERLLKDGALLSGDASAEAESAPAAVLKGGQFLVDLTAEPRAARMFRGNRVVALEEVTRANVERFCATLTEWLVGAVQSDGRMIYKWWPSRGGESEANNAIRQWMATLALGSSELCAADDAGRRGALERNLAFNVSNFYKVYDGHPGVEDPNGVKLGAIALAALAMRTSHVRGLYAEQEAGLRSTIDFLWRPDGSFRTFLLPETRTGLENFYPGEALLYLSHVYAETREAGLLERITAAREYYKAWHLEPKNRNPAFVPWHAQAYTVMFEATGDRAWADWTLEMCDWLVGLQRVSWSEPDVVGDWYLPRNRRFGPSHASSTGVYLEGIADGFKLARALGDERRAERYRSSIALALRNLMQLQFADDVDMYYVRRVGRVQGGMRTTPWDNSIRVDNVQHTLLGVMKVLREFKDEDYAAGVAGGAELMKGREERSAETEEGEEVEE
ncbi:MAG: hypothetical protein SFZ24_12665 [Planctomycetota bacterium]|nr:hypothetical protein [Planctomycetota bacterium]